MEYPGIVFTTINYFIVFPQNALNSVMISLFGVSVFVGLSLHVLALGELEDALYEAEEIFMRTNV